MRYAKIRKQDITNGNGIRVSIFFQGCKFHCPHCWNKSTWNFDGGYPLTQSEINLMIELGKKEHIKGFSILGGEPLHQPHDQLFDFIEQLKSVGKSIYMWTGYTYEAIPNEYRDCLKYVDILIDGQFKEELKDPSLKWRGSSNQRIIHLVNGEINYIEQ